MAGGMDRQQDTATLATAPVSVRPRHYVLATAIGILPATILYVYFGSLLTDATQLGASSGGMPGRVFLYSGLVVTLVVTVVLARLARRRLRETMPGVEV